MQKFMVVAMCGMMSLAVWGCNKDKHHEEHKSGTTTKQAMKADACSHCPGVQTVTADGKCSGCGAKVKS